MSLVAVEHFASLITPVQVGYSIQFKETDDKEWRNVLDFYKDARGVQCSRLLKFSALYSAKKEAAIILGSSAPKWINVVAVRVVPYVSG